MRKQKSQRYSQLSVTVNEAASSKHSVSEALKGENKNLTNLQIGKKYISKNR